MAWADVQNTTVSFNGLLGIFLLSTLLLGAFNWFFVMMSAATNSYYTTSQLTPAGVRNDASDIKGQDAFEVATPAAKDLIHFVGKRMSKGLRMSSAAEFETYNNLQTSKETPSSITADDEKSHDALRALTVAQFFIYLTVAFVFLWVVLGMIISKFTGTQMMGVVSGGK